MGKVVLIYSIKPEGQEASLNEIAAQVKKLPYFTNLEIKPFMFGMNQILATFMLEDKVQTTGVESIENGLNKIPGVGSVTQEAMTLL